MYSLIYDEALKIKFKCGLCCIYIYLPGHYRCEGCPQLSDKHVLWDKSAPHANCCTQSIVTGSATTKSASSKQVRINQMHGLVWPNIKFDIKIYETIRIIYRYKKIKFEIFSTNEIIAISYIKYNNIIYSA